MSRVVEVELTKGIKITITPVKVDAEPPITIFNVCIESQGGVWNDTFGSGEQLAAYLRGLQAGSMMFANTYISCPSIPRIDSF